LQQKAYGEGPAEMKVIAVSVVLERSYGLRKKEANRIDDSCG
jgi:hypothetical protein